MSGQGGRYKAKQMREIRAEAADAARFRPSILSRLIGQVATVKATGETGTIVEMNPQAGTVTLEINGNRKDYRGIELNLPL